MIYVNINTELNHMRENRMQLSRIEFLRLLFTKAQKEAAATNNEVMMSGYLYKKDMVFIKSHINGIIVKEVMHQKPVYFCRFIVNKDTQIN